MQGGGKERNQKFLVEGGGVVILILFQPNPPLTYIQKILVEGGGVVWFKYTFLHFK